MLGNDDEDHQRKPGHAVCKDEVQYPPTHAGPYSWAIRLRRIRRASGASGEDAASLIHGSHSSIPEGRGGSSWGWSSFGNSVGARRNFSRSVVGARGWMASSWPPEGSGAAFSSGAGSGAVVSAGGL